MLAGDPDSAERLPRVRLGCIRLSLDSDLRALRSLFGCELLIATGLGVARRESESFDDPSPSSDSERFSLLCSSGGRLKFVSSFGNGSGSRSSSAFRLLHSLQVLPDLFAADFAVQRFAEPLNNAHHEEVLKRR